MKRILCMLLFCLSALCLTACVKEPPTVDSAFEGSFSVTQNGIPYQGDLCIDSEGMRIVMSEPYTVSGIEFCYSSDGLSIRCAGHQTNANCDYLSPSAPPEILHNTLTYLPQAAYLSSEDGTDTFTLPTPYGDVELTAQEGVIASLTDPHSDTVFTFLPA